jgi:hypothetical protein
MILLQHVFLVTEKLCVEKCTYVHCTVSLYTGLNGKTCRVLILTANSQFPTPILGTEQSLLKSRVVDPDPMDPDSATLWIRIWIRIGNPDPGSGSRGKKIKKFLWKNALFSYLKKTTF